MQVGADIGLHVGANFIESFPERVVTSHVIPLLNEAGRLGEKTGAGFYKYASRKQQPDPEGIKGIIAESQKRAGLQQVCTRCAVSTARACLAWLSRPLRGHCAS